MRLLRWLLSLRAPQPTLCDQMRKVWGQTVTADIRYPEADDRKVRIQRTRTWLRRAG